MYIENLKCCGNCLLSHNNIQPMCDRKNEDVFAYIFCEHWLSDEIDRDQKIDFLNRRQQFTNKK